MRVLRGRISDADREVLYAANRECRPVLVATLHACVIQHGLTRCEEPMQAVGIPQGWNYDSFKIGSVTTVWQTNIPWMEAVRIWPREEAPSKEDVAALLAEQMELREANRDGAALVYALLYSDIPPDPDTPETRAAIAAAREKFRVLVWSELGLTLESLRAHMRKNRERILAGEGA